jgi:hypothetical protein
MSFILRTDYKLFLKENQESFGVENYWTLVYDEGLFMKHNELTLFAFFKYINY